MVVQVFPPAENAAFLDRAALFWSICPLRKKANIPYPLVPGAPVTTEPLSLFRYFFLVRLPKSRAMHSAISTNTHFQHHIFYCCRQLATRPTTNFAGNTATVPNTLPELPIQGCIYAVEDADDAWIRTVQFVRTYNGSGGSITTQITSSVTDHAATEVAPGSAFLAPLLEPAGGLLVALGPTSSIEYVHLPTVRPLRLIVLAALCVERSTSLVSGAAIKAFARYLCICVT